MNEYSYDNVLIDPNKEGIDRLIGKEVYFEDNPSYCLMHANDRSTDSLGVLVRIVKDSANPFRIEQNGSVHSCPCIIEKKGETETKHVPFESKEEFVERYKEVMEVVEFDSFEDNLFQCGMWLKHADDDPSKSVYRLVSLIKDEGVRISEWGFFDWGDLLLAGFLFLDDTPCGKEKK